MFQGKDLSKYLTVPSPDCVSVFSQQCEEVPEEVCTTVPTTVCEEVEEQVCTQQPQQVCDGVQPVCQLVHKKIPVRVSKKVPKRVCGGDGGANLGGSGNIFLEKKHFLINKLKHKLGKSHYHFHYHYHC